MSKITKKSPLQYIFTMIQNDLYICVIQKEPN